jgi:hypothetical protein
MFYGVRAGLTGNAGDQDKKDEKRREVLHNRNFFDNLIIQRHLHTRP